MKNKKTDDDYEVTITNQELIPAIGISASKLAVKLYKEGKIKLPNYLKEA